MTAVLRGELPVMPLEDAERHAILDAFQNGDLSHRLKSQVESVLITLAALDTREDPEDRAERDADHASSWRVVRRDWRQFIAAWREEHPQVTP